jgi:hypothetical protein
MSTKPNLFPFCQVHEMEAEAYNEEIKELYRVAAEIAKALREIYEENLIEKLFTENV